MLVSPAPISLATSVVPSTFAAWAAQGPEDSENIHTVYASFAGAEEDYVSEFLREVLLSEGGGEVTFGVCIKM